MIFVHSRKSTSQTIQAMIEIASQQNAQNLFTGDLVSKYTSINSK